MPEALRTSELTQNEPIMKLPATFGYATRVWLSGVVAGPASLVLLTAVLNLLKQGSVFQPNSGGGLAFMGVVFLFGLILSVPSWWLLMWAAKIICQQRWGAWRKKWMLFGIASVLTLIPFLLLNFKDPSMAFENITGFFVPFYWGAIAFGIFYFQLPTQPPAESEQPQD